MSISLSSLNLNKQSEAVGRYLEKNPTVNKVVISAYQFFRAGMMMGAMRLMPFSQPINFSLGLGVNAGYRLAVERKCQYKFALLSSLGALAMEHSLSDLAKLIQGVAFASMKDFSKSLTGSIPFFLYSAWMIYQVNQEVNGSSCCARTRCA
jgi:hypothetical protein